MEQARLGLQVAPRSFLINLNLGGMLVFARRCDEAILQLQNTHELDATNPRRHLYLGRAYLGKGLHDDAIATLQQGAELSGADKRIVGVLGHAYALTGRREEAELLLTELKAARPLHLASFAVALIYAGLRDADRTFEWLDKAYEERSAPLRFLKVDPLFDSIRSDPRFAEILARMGLDTRVGREPA